MNYHNGRKTSVFIYSVVVYVFVNFSLLVLISFIFIISTNIKISKCNCFASFIAMKKIIVGDPTFKHFFYFGPKLTSSSRIESVMSCNEAVQMVSE